MKKIILLFNIWFLAIAGFAQTIDASLEAASIGYCIVDEAGNIVAQKDGEKSLIPASTLKLITTATALELYSSDYRFQTKIQYDGTIEEGVLNGNIYIKGGGDATLGSSLFHPENRNSFWKQWITAVQNAGIFRINGMVVADESCFDLEGVSSKWLKEDMGNYYAAGCYGLAYNDNMYMLYLRSGLLNSSVEIVKTEPKIDLQFENYAVAANNKKDSIYIQGEPYSNHRFLYGTMPTNQYSFVVNGDIPDPALFLASAFREKLATAGIQVTGKTTTYRLLCLQQRWTNKPRKELCTTESQPLSEIVKFINYNSNNLYAEHLMKSIALSKYSPATTALGIRMLKDYWKQKGLSTKNVFMVDGCGLSPLNAVSPRFFTQMLTAMRKSQNFNSFYASLPIAGEEGTVQSFLQNTRLRGKVRAKSGSMSGVYALAGYVALGNKNYAFAISVNHFDCEKQKVKQEIENILLSMIPRQ